MTLEEQEYEQWLNDPVAQAEYQQWRADQDQKRAQLPDPFTTDPQSFLNQFNRIFKNEPLR
jgi:hypothetical protein